MNRKYLTAGLCLLGAALAGCGAAQGSAASGTGSKSTAPTELPALTGGSGSGPANASLAGIHACKLISPAQVSSILGNLASPPNESPDGLACDYAVAAPGGIGNYVSVTVVERSGYEASKTFSESVAQTGAAKVVTISGLGDDAFSLVQTNGSHTYSLWAARAGRAVAVSSDGNSSADEQQVKDLMKIAIANL